MPYLHVTNISDDVVFLADLYASILPGNSVLAYRSYGQLSAMSDFQDAVTSGLISVSYTETAEEALLPKSSSDLYTTQAAFVVDPVNGNDTNSGLSASSAIRTNEELGRRINKVPLKQNVTITYLSYPPQSDPLDLDLTVGFVDASTPAVITFEAPAFTTKKSGNITATTARNRATNTANAITVGASLDATDVGLRAFVTSGARQGAAFFLAKDNGGGSLRISEPAQVTVDAVGTVPVVLSAGGGGDPISVVQAPGTMYVRQLHFQGESGQYPDMCKVVFKNFDFANADSIVQTTLIEFENATIVFSFCRFLGASNAQWTLSSRVTQNGLTWSNLLNCMSESNIIWAGHAGSYAPDHYVDTGLFLSYSYVAGTWVEFDHDPLFQGGFLCVTNNGRANIDTAGIFDWSAASGGGLLVSYGGRADVGLPSVYGDGGFLWGSSANAAYGVDIYDDSVLRYVTGSRLTITGASGDFRLGGLTTTFPFDDTTHVYGVGVTNTWAHLVAGFGASGFGDNAHSPRHNAHLFKVGL